VHLRLVLVVLVLVSVSKQRAFHCRDGLTSFSESVIVTSMQISAPPALTRRMQSLLHHRHSLQSARQPQRKMAREMAAAQRQQQMHWPREPMR
jgi:hypothetical protein